MTNKLIETKKKSLILKKRTVSAFNNPSAGADSMHTIPTVVPTTTVLF